MKQLKQRSAIFIGTLLFFALAACTPTVEPGSSQPAVPTPDDETAMVDPVEPDEPAPELGETMTELDGTKWDLISLAGTDVTDKGATLEFDAGQAGGSDSCNRYGSSYRIEGGNLVFDGPFISTEMACVDMEISAQYLEMLASAGTISLEGDTLTIQTEQGELVYRQPISAALENTKWTLTSLNSGNAIVSMAIDPNIFLMIEGDAIGGNGGCNSFGGGVEIEGEQIAFKEIFSTQMFCEGDGISEREAEFLAALDRTVRFEIVRQSLTLFDINGDLAATFQVTDESAGMIDGITWSLVHMIVGGDAIVPAPAGTNIYFVINDEAMSGNSGCNMFNGSVSLDGNALTMGPFAATRMACMEEIMSYETAILEQLTQVGSYAVDGKSLILSTADGLPLAEFTMAETKTLLVGPDQVDCEGVAPQKCLLVKEEAGAEYTYFYDSIEGFEWEAGFEYELLVSVTEVKEPLADASSLVYKLVQIVNQTPAAE